MGLRLGLGLGMGLGLGVTSLPHDNHKGNRTTRQRTGHRVPARRPGSIAFKFSITPIAGALRQDKTRRRQRNKARSKTNKVKDKGVRRDKTRGQT